MDENKNKPTDEQMQSILESALFVHGEPVKISKLAKILNLSKGDLESKLLEMENEFSQSKRGLILMRKEDEIQLATNPDNSEYVNKLVKVEMEENLSDAALEVLSIVAYRGPVSRAKIEAIRGVNSSFTLRNLLLRGLIERAEDEKDARAYLYKASFDLLKKLGLRKVEELPNWQELSHDFRVDQITEDIKE